MTITFLGAGSMAEALISGVTQTLYEPKQMIVTNRSRMERLTYMQQTYGVRIETNKEQAVKEANIVILAMKPKDVAESLTPIAHAFHEQQLIISLLAGVTTDTIASLIGKQMPVIRAMPNTSAAIGQSATALAQGAYATDKHVHMAKELFETVGIVTIVDEKHLHAVTGLSGSGPAYVYYLVEAMEKAADEIGLERDIAKELILQTIIGAAHMLKATNKHPSVLRKEVTSPGGTTEAGIGVLERYRYQEAMIACIKRATERSKELGEALLSSVQ
ncbi:pyrroline-5-carboxylate reductase ProI [Anoxybacillus ayderensis]|uniref:pyrroline-5-carboxylate reductase ProI n=1 Tax=Anoxybacillus ayderensis TaxID=265546 RepID=UPI000A270AC0|nr:pyrroline-5-carboxylate reductase ProI [Anoxybacillus ayderensis]MBA2879061.1 pyrroline-5-carboxylate reductase [Anoxybacillus ayderensis]MED0657483.1 pyrroline-5-carboxylate reductase ProI [Anoxybacillus ayderensis]OSX54659.1 pyrroline-5-carboxylate reductase [Anoxybacillus ayderensis]